MRHESVSNIKKYDLSEFMDEEESVSSHKTTKPQQNPEVEEPQVVKRVVEPSFSDSEEEIDPMNTPLAELSARAAERKAKMKQFNHKFRSTNSIDEIEKQPAYKRAGVELSNSRTEENFLSRTSVKGDKDNLNFKSNNSFLHDNVD
jgi:cell division protein FtsZ